MPGALKDDAMRVAITPSGDIYFGLQRVELYGLHEHIETEVQNGTERKVYLSVDDRAKYSVVKMVRREVRLAGIENVSFLTN
jgi:biopolymer transport protein ExbD